MKSKILIVDDSKTYIIFASSLLEKAGYEVLIADNIFISRLVNDEKPDLILMDITLGRTNGTNAVTAIKKRNLGKGIKIYLHSSEPMNVLSDLCLECGADGFIEKSGDGNRFIESIHKIIRNPVLAERV